MAANTGAMCMCVPCETTPQHAFPPRTPPPISSHPRLNSNRAPARLFRQACCTLPGVHHYSGRDAASALHLIWRRVEPGRCVTSCRQSSSSHPGGEAVDTEMRLVCSTSSSSASPHRSKPPARKPDDIWAAVRARRAELAAAAAASPNPDQGRHKARAGADFPVRV